MPTAENAILYYEAGQTLVPMVALTDQGDHLDFRSAATLWSDKSGFGANVKPNGIATGGAVTPATLGGDDDVDVSALTCYLIGVLTSVGADADVQISRGVDADTHRINSITVTAAGAIAAVAGVDGGAFSETRGANGGPPLIDVGAIEIAQVRTTSVTAAPITAAEIFQVVGTHRERFDFPTWEVKRSNVLSGVSGYAGVLFNSALPLIHVGVLPKRVYAQYYTPVFAQIPKAADFVPAGESFSVGSTQIYGLTLGAVSKSLGQGSFQAYFEDGVTDGLLYEDGKKLWFKFKPDRLKDPYLLTQGYLGVSQTFPAADNIGASCTISAEVKSDRVSG